MEGGARKTGSRGRKAVNGLPPKGETRRAAVLQALATAHGHSAARTSRGATSQRRATRAKRQKGAPPPPLHASRTALHASAGEPPPSRPRHCASCVYAGRVHGGRPCALVCVNHPDQPGELTRVKPCSGCPNFRRRYEPPLRLEPPEPPNPHVRYIALTKGKFTLVDAEDYDRLMRHKWTAYYASGKWYAARNAKGTSVMMHREIMNTPKGMVVDHINGRSLINCKFNLRNCTQSQNIRNSRPRGPSSRFKGVRYDKDRKKYAAFVWEDRKCIMLGRYDNEVEAARVRDYRAVEIAGPYAWLNLPQEWPPERVRAVHKAAQARRRRHRKPTQKRPAVKSGRR